jgi:hypothetical protein
MRARLTPDRQAAWPRPRRQGSTRSPVPRHPPRSPRHDRRHRPPRQRLPQHLHARGRSKRRSRLSRRTNLGRKGSTAGCVRHERGRAGAPHRGICPSWLTAHLGGGAHDEDPAVGHRCPCSPRRADPRDRTGGTVRPKEPRSSRLPARSCAMLVVGHDHGERTVLHQRSRWRRSHERQACGYGAAPI